ncbi:MAG: DUF3224 domain-containing protein [Chloroflexi bacterium]|nr:DUF3224 domain-containing protein [Chloroflexota bacterium]
MIKRASGTFHVTLQPQPDDFLNTLPLKRLTIDKQFYGDLEAVSRGQMLSLVTPVDGSAGYVALEQVRGTLQGRSGSFVLQHSGSMNRGMAQLSITVVPDSGTGELTGLAGTMTISIVDDQHQYDFEYFLPDSA